MRLPGFIIVIVVVLALAGCDSDLEPVIKQTTPLNGETGVDVYIRPVLVLSNGAGLNLFPAEEEKAVLYRLADGTRHGVAGEVEWAGARLTYLPRAPLEPASDYELELKRSAIAPAEVTHRDAAEWPEEPVTWPYRLRFSTRAAPRVRAAYLDVPGGNRRIHLRFSQPMNPVVTEQQIGVRDLQGTAAGFQQPVWSDGGTSLVLDLYEPLIGAELYTLEIGAQAVALDGTPLDGDADGVPGEPNDAFRINFTGTQQVILSRLPPD